MGSVCDVNLTLPVLPSTEINKHNMRHYSRSSSRLVAETRADAREVLPVAYGMRLLQQITSAAPVAFYQWVCECEACVI